MNLRGPSRKTKYEQMSDSEKYREGKEKQNPVKGSEKEREIASLQTEGKRL